MAKNIYVQGVVPQAIRVKEGSAAFVGLQIVRTNSTEVWRESQDFPGLSVPEFYNYYALDQRWGTQSALSASSIDVRGFDTLTFPWSLRTTMSWPNANGVYSISRVYIQMADGSYIFVGEAGEWLWTAGSAYATSGTAVIDISGYSDAAKNGIKLYATLGEMRAPTPGETAGTDRHNLTASTGTITAS